MFDLGILDGRIYQDGQWMDGNLYIKDGIIMEITNNYLEAREEYDVDGKYVLPGFIDPHVHFALNVGRYTSVDDFRSGSISAAFGGITTFIDFLDPVYRAEEIKTAFDKRRQLARDSVLDYGFHATLCNPRDEPEKIVKKVKELGIPSVKFFTTYTSSNRNTPDGYLDRMMQLSGETSTLMLVHAENEGMIREGKGIPVCQHEKSRPAISEISEVIKLAEMCNYHNALLYIVHVSCGTTVKRLKDNYGNLLNKSVFIESCPHYFTFNEQKYEDGNGARYTMTPPLRSEEERQVLIDNIDSISALATDHCPFDSKDKKGGFISDLPMGIGGVEHSFPIMYTAFGDKIIDRYTKNPAVIHGLFPRKGSLQPGSDADVVVFDSEKEWIVCGHHSKCDYVPYDGFHLKGKVITTISRGRFIIKDEQFNEGVGQYLHRKEMKV